MTVASTPGGTDTEILSVSSACLIVLKSGGLSIQQSVYAPPWPVDVVQLELLAEIDRSSTADFGVIRGAVAARADVPEQDLNDVFFRFRYATNVIVGPKARHAAAPPAGGAAGEPVPAIDLADPRAMALRTPLTLRLREGMYEIIDHDGWLRASLSPTEVAALAPFGRPVTAAHAFAAQAETSGRLALDEAAFSHVLGLMDSAGLLVVEDAQATEGVAFTPPVDRDAVIREVFDRHAAQQTAAEQERERTTGRKRVKVIPVAFDMSSPSGLGMIIAHAKAYEDGVLEEHYDFRTDWVWSDDRLAEFTAEPAIYLFSNYLWSHQRCLEVSERVKQLSPASITIHGGPDTPKYEKDQFEYFDRYPHVDVTVRGEGEMTAAHLLDVLRPVIGSAEPDLSVLRDVAGIGYRDHEGVHRTEDRGRIADLDTIPSPFLTGLFDVFADVPDTFVTFETNRGCPYGCTFCDWGSATTSRIRKFDLERVFAEIDWASNLGVDSISVADANFGIFARDIEIAQRVADEYRENGRPKAFGVAYAKNTVKHVRPIISILADAGIMTQGVLALQTMDADTLDVIHRSNIKTDQYDQLANEMRLAKLPLMVELMMGLPGMTVESFADDLQQCIDRNVPARINITTLLVNSPMNEPEYLAEHQIETEEPMRPGLNAVVVSTSTFDRAGHLAMVLMRSDFMLFENWSVLRHVAPFIRQETGLREIDFYRLVRTRVIEQPQTWPTLHALVSFGSDLMAPPHSWALVMAELREFLISETGIEPSSGLDAVLKVQHALLPSHGRTFPEVIELDHDVVRWVEQILATKAAGHLHDWDEHVPHLGSFGPGVLTVDDPDDIVHTSIGVMFDMNVIGFNWEFDSPLSRASVAATQFADWVTDSLLTTKHNDDDPDPGASVQVSLARKT